jgi:formylglycine-generating enzyme required for sulfatase activity
MSRYLLAGVLGALLIGACDSSGGSGDSETHWLRCTTDHDCPSDQICEAKQCVMRPGAGGRASGGADAGAHSRSAGGTEAAGGRAAGGGASGAASTLPDGSASPPDGGARGGAPGSGGSSASAGGGAQASGGDASTPTQGADSGTPAANDASVQTDGGSPDASGADTTDAGVSDAGDAGASCETAATRCWGNAVETCRAGRWQSGTPCGGATPFCFDGACSTEPPSCHGGGAGTGTDCGDGTEDCCASTLVEGGTFDRDYDGVSPGLTDPSHPATVSTFRLDRYEVTVGRFRKFVDAKEAGWVPLSGSGKHTHLNGGRGLLIGGSVDRYEGGLSAQSSVRATHAAWDDRFNTVCPYQATWTSDPGSHERNPINCITWYEAREFCVWDGGFLPTEAEWNYAAAGGSEQRVYPWSSPPASTTVDETYAAYCNDVSCAVRDVGTFPKGNGRWGQADLGGNIEELTLDFYDGSYVMPCVDCVYWPASTTVTGRGGSFSGPASAMLVSLRDNVLVTDIGPYVAAMPRVGVRCARAP